MSEECVNIARRVARQAGVDATTWNAIWETLKQSERSGLVGLNGVSVHNIDMNGARHITNDGSNTETH